MRLRNTVAAAGALLLVLSVPASAFAADGVFEYRYGSGIPGSLVDPDSGSCIDLPEAGPDTPAYAPKNFTDRTATVFVDFECNGDTYYVMNPGKKLGDKLKLHSVIFS